MANVSSLSPAALSELRAQWRSLHADILSAIPDGPHGPSAPALLRRWTALLGQLIGQPADPEFLAHYQSRDWTPGMATFVDEPTWMFMREVWRHSSH